VEGSSSRAATRLASLNAGRKAFSFLPPMVGYRRPRHDEVATDMDNDNAADEHKTEQQLIEFRAVST
jgi:hypothetical protein